MKIGVSTAQKRSLMRGKAINLSNDQLNGKMKSGKVHEVEIDDNHSKGMQSALRRGKGYRVTGGSMIPLGGNIFKSIKKGANKAVKSATKAVNKADVGSAIQQIKSNIPPVILETAITGALVAGGVDPVTASTTSAGISAGIQEVDFSKNLKGQGDDFAKAVVVGGLQSYTTGQGFMDSVKKSAIALASDKDVQKMALKAGKTAYKNYNKKKATTEGSGYADSKGINAMASDDVKTPSGGAMRRANPALVRSNIQYDPNVSLRGGSFKPLGGSFKPLGSGFKRPAKGSQEAKDYMKMLRDRRGK